MNRRDDVERDNDSPDCPSSLARFDGTVAPVQIDQARYFNGWIAGHIPDKLEGVGT